MFIKTRSGPVKRAIFTVLQRMPDHARRRVQEFISVIWAQRDYSTFGLDGIDRASAGLFPLYNNLKEIGEKEYAAQVIVTLPIFHLFSPRAQVGIIAHEFAHAERASRLGSGWHEQMQSRYSAEEKLADAIAIRWGFGADISVLHNERHTTVNPIFEARVPKIMRRLNEE